MYEIAKFLYQQQPAFWWALGFGFFGLGFLYASVSWRGWKRQLRRAQREQRSLLDERQTAMEDRQRPWERRLEREEHGEVFAASSPSTDEIEPATVSCAPSESNSSVETPPVPVLPQVTPGKVGSERADDLAFPQNDSIPATPASMGRGLFSDSYVSGPQERDSGG